MIYRKKWSEALTTTIINCSCLAGVNNDEVLLMKCSSCGYSSQLRHLTGCKKWSAAPTANCSQLGKLTLYKKWSASFSATVVHSDSWLWVMSKVYTRQLQQSTRTACKKWSITPIATVITSDCWPSQIYRSQIW